MPILALGISHHTAPLALRERMAIARDQYADHVHQVRQTAGLEEAVVVSTCNRTELYAFGPVDALDRAAEWLFRSGELEAEQAATHSYRHEGEAAVAHLFRVACGLDSLVLGEPQILGQLKEAWGAAREADGVGKIMDRLFQRAFAVSKQVRTRTGINDHPVSVAYITAILARQIFGKLEQKTILLVGAGEMITLCAQHFQQQGVGKLMIANRSPERAQELAASLEATAMGLDQLPAQLPEADVVISSTAASEPVIALDTVEAAIKIRKHAPVFMVDLGVPRDMDPRIAELNDVYLYTIDDLRQVADESLNRRQRAAREAESTISSEVNGYLRWLRGARAADSLRLLRQQAELNNATLTERALRQLRAGGDAEAIIQQLGHGLTQRMLHGPSTRLRQAAEEQEDAILRAAAWLFETPDEEPAQPPDEEEDA